LPRKGLPKWAISEARRRGARNIFAYAWSLVKRRGRKGSSRTKKTRKRSVGGLVRKKRRYSRKLTVPIAPLAGAFPMFASSINAVMTGQFDKIPKRLAWDVVGWDMDTNQFNPSKFVQNITPLILGLLVHKFVGGSPLNLNRTLARHKIPFIRI